MFAVITRSSCLINTVWRKQVVTSPGRSQNNVDPTGCQIITLTPPPITRRPETGIQPTTRTPKCDVLFFSSQRPRVHIAFPQRPFLLSRRKHSFQLHPFFCHTVTLLLILNVSPEENSRDEAHLREAERKEKPLACLSKRSQCLRKDYKKICFLFPN